MGKKQNKNNKKATNTTTSSKPQQSIPIPSREDFDDDEPRVVELPSSDEEEVQKEVPQKPTSKGISPNNF